METAPCLRLSLASEASEWCLLQNVPRAGGCGGRGMPVVSRHPESGKSQRPAWSEWGQQGRLGTFWGLYPAMYHLLQGIVESAKEHVNSSGLVQMGCSRPCLHLGKAPGLSDIQGAIKPSVCLVDKGLAIPTLEAKGPSPLHKRIPGNS